MRILFKFVLYVLVITSNGIARADSYVDFFRAVNTDNARTVNELLAKGFDPNTRSTSGQVALYLALGENFSPKVADALLTSPALDVNAANAVGETPLMMAAMHGRLDWANKLLARGAAVQKPGWSPLHYAATGPNIQVLTLLLDRGADINSRAPNGSTPLMMAARYGAEDNVKLLVKRGADKELRNDRNLSALDMARSAGRTYLVPLLQ